MERRRHRWWLYAALAVVAVLIVTVWAGLAWLRGEGGQAFLREKALSAVKDSIAGRLELGSVAFDADQLTLRDVKLYTPEGELVAEVKRVTAKLELQALLREQLRLADVEVTDPHLFLVQDERGLNLSRAVAAKSPSTSGAPEKWRIEVRGFTLSGGQVDLQSPSRRISADRLSASGSADLTTAPLHGEAELLLKGGLQRPLVAPLELRLTAKSPRAAELEATVAAALGRSHVDARVTWPNLELKTPGLVADPETMRAFLPDWPLKVPLAAEGRVSTKDGAVTLRAGKTVVTAAGAWDLDAARVDTFELAVKDLNLAELLEGGKASRITLVGRGSLKDARADTLTGTATASGTWATLDARELAKVSVTATAKGGAVELKQLEATLPGLALTGGGRGTRRELALTAHADVKDLSQLSAVLSEFTGAQVPLSGNGALDLTLSGPVSHPGVTAKGRLAVLRVDSVAADALDVDVNLPDMTRPLDTDGVLSARRLRIGERAFDEVTAKVTTQGRQLDAELTMRGLGALTARVAGEVARDSQGITLSSLGLSSPEAEWALEAPARITWPDAQLTIAPLALRSGAQRVSFEMKKVGQRVDGQLQLEHLALDKLPRVLAPESLGLAGEVRARATVSGALPRPTVEAGLAVTRGAIAGVKGIDASLDGTWKGQRATGKATVTAEPGAVTADFDLPVEAWLSRRDEAWRAHLSASRLDLKALAALSKREVPATGVLSLEADLEGSTNEPRLMLTVETPELALEVPISGAQRTLTLTRVATTVSTREGGKLGALVSASGLGGLAVVNLATPLTLSGLRAKLPTADELRGTPVTLGVELKGVDLAQLHALGLTDDDELAGVATAKAELRGTVASPRGRLSVSLAKAVKHPFSNFDVTATLDAADERTAVSVEAAVGGKPALTAEASIAMPVERLDDVDRLGDRSIKGTGTLYPVELSQLLKGVDGAPGAKGSAMASFEASGTLDAPTVYAAGSVQNLQFASVPLGSARFVWKGPSGAQALNLALGGQGRDDLKVRGTTGVDLSFAKLRKGLDLSAATLALDVDARDLDLAFLSGATADVRVVGGRLTMKGDVVGTVGLPRFKGDATWTSGRLSLLGFGEYREIDLAVHATNDLFDLQRLRVRAGAGIASFKARATRAGEAFHLVAEGTAEKFPVVTDDQLVATVSLKTTLTGELTNELVDIRGLELPRVEVALPDVKRRDLQDLERPADVIIVRGGQRISSRARKAAREKAREQEETARPSGRSVRAVVTAPRNIWVRSSDLNVELGLSENFRIERADKVQIFGEALLLRGRINVIGREFEVQKSSQLRFAGPAKEPYVNVLALHNNEREKVKVTVTVVGRGTDVALKVSSDPPMTESDIYTLLATGRRELRRGSGASITPEQAVSVVGNVAASQLRQVLAKKLPIDVLNFEASENFESVKLDVGKYLSDSVFLGYTFQPGAREDRGENQHAGRLEYQFSRNWALEAYAGTAPAAGADVMWSRDF